jgi:cytochrome P450
MGLSAMPPGPCQPALAQTLAFWYRPLPFLLRCREAYGDRFTLRILGMRPTVIVSSPDDVRTVLSADPTLLLPGAGADLIDPVVGSRSVARLDGDAHVAARQLLLPAFRSGRVRQRADLIHATATAAIATWPADRPIAVRRRFAELSLDVILQVTLGLDRRDERWPPLREAFAAFLHSAERLPNLLPQTRRAPFGRGPWARFLAARATTNRLLLDLVAERRTTRGSDHDVLAELLRARDQDGASLSDADLRDQLVTVILGGHASIATALSWACLAIAHEPAARRRLLEEIDADTGSAYLEATIQESLRRRPIMPFFPRLVAREATVGDWTYPAGIALQPDAYLLHHDPEIYPDPFSFRPERFLERRPGAHDWLPFGGGRRRCPGAPFAHVEMATVLRAVLSVRRIEPVGSPEPARRQGAAIAPERDGRLLLVRR